MSRFRASLAEHYSPLVLVIASPEAEALCARNGLSVVDLLSPHCTSRPNVTIRTSELPYRLHEFTLRVAAPHDCEALTPEAAEALAATALCSSDGGALDAELGASASAVVAAARAGDAPHFEAFRAAFVEALRFGDHEAVDHPVGCLLVQAAPLAGDPVRAFADQFRGENMPSLLRAGVADPVLLRHHLLLHDASLGGAAGAAAAEAVRAEVAATFGPGAVTLLTVNSRFAQQPPLPPLRDMWTAARRDRRGAPPAPPPADDAVAAADGSLPQLGHCLTDADVARVRTFMEEFAAKQLVPFIESKVVNLSAAIAATRKGLRNTLKSLWKGKEPRAVELPPDGAYNHATPEAQLRLCADLALMLRDYELAAGHLRLAAADFRADRAHRQAGAASEALGCALAAADAPRREIDAAFDAAWVAYRGAPPRRGAPLAVRAALLHAAALGGSATGGSAAAAPLVRASADAPDMVAAALLEAAAAAQAAGAPPRLRKAAFHGVLAGHRYTLAGARHAAVRAYAAALPLLAGRRWRHGEAHIRFALARHLAHAAAMPAAAAQFAALLGSAPGSPASHVAHLREFAFVADACAAAGAPLRVLPLRAPGVDTRRVRCASEDHRGYSGAAARQLPEATWAALEAGPPGVADAALIPSELAAAAAAADGGAGNWLDGGGAGRAAAAAAEQACACCAGEAVTADVALHNPLATPLDIEALRLEATFRPVADDAPAAAAAQPSEAPTPDPPLPLATEEQALQLQPGERVVVRLRATPPSRGELRLTGVTWRLGAVPGAAAFDVAAPLRRRSSSGAWQRDAPPGSRLLFRVGPPAPRLAASLEALPDAVPAGALLRVALRLTNAGTAPLYRLRMALSTPLLLPGSAPLPLSGAAPADAALVPLDADARPWPAPFAFPEQHASLAPGQSMDWPVWIHAAEAAPLESIQVSIFYAAVPAEADAPLAPSASSAMARTSQGAVGGGPALRFRVLRLAAALAVRPGLRAEAAAAAADSRAGRRVLHVSASAADAYRGFTLRRASVAGAGVRPGAKLSALGADHAGDGGSVPAGAARALLLALDDAPATSPATSAASSLCVELEESAALSAEPMDPVVPPAVVAAFVARAAAAAAVAATAATAKPGAEAPPLLVALEWWAGGAPGVPPAAGMHVLHAPPPPAPPPALHARLRGAAAAALPGGERAGLPAQLTLRCELRNDSAVAAHPLLELLPPEPTGGWRAAAAAAVGDADADAAGRGLRGGGRYAWTGATRRALPALPPGGAAATDVQLLLAAPGVTDVRRWRLSWRLEGEEAPPHGAPLPHAQDVNPPFLVEVTAPQ